MPRLHGDSGVELVMINTAGGLTGGDRLSIEVVVGERACATVTTPACEHIYRSLGSEASIEQRLQVARGAKLDWIPQETILFDRGRVRRQLDAWLEADAELTIAEAVLFGRTAMGETVTNGFLSDFWTVRRDGHLLFADATRIAESFSQSAACLAALRGQTAMASVVHVGRNLERKRDRLRAGFSQATESAAGASVIGDVLVARIVAPGRMALRRALVPALASLRDTRPLPRLWYC
ncbi:urease accessory protein UreD [Pseudaminobacter sp. 19-2017]|uniref:Urease accessory protein UreD n=1 Tax=Pseudaminobacter soli (ex Zhang et al. 2022) TaxID=2831468 RepID=A0A942E8T1_9HYPH|nr:urease accessory protein UreD [Pseudaminobacter soli]MBS3652515.1 urease accessory protein UreD [Pseudaminobacter soli]